MEEHCILVTLHSLPSLLSHITQDYLSRRGTAHGGLDSPTLIINQENTL